MTLPLTYLDQIEPCLSYARQAVDDGLDTAFAQAALVAARDYIRLFLPRPTRRFDPAKRLRAFASRVRNEYLVFDLESISPCTGDPELVQLLLEILIKNVQLEGDSGLVIGLADSGGVPRVELVLDGPGQWPDPVLIGGCMLLEFERLNERWTVATRGGRIDRTPAGLTCRLGGERILPQGEADPVRLEQLYEAVSGAEKRVRMLDAEGADQKATLADARKSLDEALALESDGSKEPPAPADLASLLAQHIEAWQDPLKSRSVQTETYTDPALPPIAVHRRCAGRAFGNVVRCAWATIESGGSVSFLLDYDPAARAAACAAVIAGRRNDIPTHEFEAAIRRAVRMHDGELEWSASPSELNVTFTFPDTIGQALDAWLPGWEFFGERSRQMLRLAKSGGGPPENLILQGVLEDELAAWLLPELDKPAMVNLAHELDNSAPPCPGGDANRREKALEQIRKRKPRKELAKPPYAAEILWAFRGDSSGRGLVAASGLDTTGIEDLCRALVANPPDTLEALRIVALARNAAGG